MIFIFVDFIDMLTLATHSQTGFIQVKSESPAFTRR